MRLRHVVVAVPARDEEQLLGRCLASLDTARAALASVRPDLAVHVVVVLDRCVDGSAAVARAAAVEVVTGDLGSVGAARNIGVGVGTRAALAAGVPPQATWVATTDADTVVPGDWLVQHVALAETGVDLVVGTVVPDESVDPRVLVAWRARHELGEGHRHVHGANLGIRADAYASVGGFAPVPLHEDVALVEAVRASGRPWVATDRARVRTSARTVGRARGGFASHLAALAAVGVPRAAGG
ncbi:glycosyltransferase [Phycicoccus avicenniae]|uniref:glycosyltransferase n=1 Tax=Phycicoccus avicenniae TaxID=2828860 RepID=UPI003D2C5D93